VNHATHDRRSVHVRLTEKGKKLRDSLMAMHQRHTTLLPQAVLSADNLRATEITLRNLERFLEP
jgi:DNA-binding MarR family transcriptional regulator